MIFAELYYGIQLGANLPFKYWRKKYDFHYDDKLCFFTINDVMSKEFVDKSCDIGTHNTENNLQFYIYVIQSIKVVTLGVPGTINPVLMELKPEWDDQLKILCKRLGLDNKENYDNDVKIDIKPQWWMSIMSWGL